MEITRTFAFFALLALPIQLSAQLDMAGLRYNFDANADQTRSDGWDSVPNAGSHPWGFTGDTRVTTGNEAPHTSTALGGGELDGISGFYNFPRTATQIESNRDRATATSYDTVGSGADATFEFWLRFDNVTDDQVIWESGGATDGSSFTISGGNLQWVILDDGATGSSAALSQAIAADGEYHHVVGVYNRDDGGTIDSMNLYFDGALVGTDTSQTTMHDWSGPDGATMGGRDSVVGGNTGALGTIDGYRNFDGRIAANRFYNTAWTVTEVGTAITAVQQNTIYFDDEAAGSTEWQDQENWDTNLVASRNQNARVNNGSTVDISTSQANVQTLTVGADNKTGLEEAPLNLIPADGAGAINMTGGTLNATQIVLGQGGNDGTFTLSGGTINVTNNNDEEFAGKQAVQIGFSAGSTSVFTMDGGTMNISGGRFEIGEDEAGGTPNITATFNMNGGDFNLNGQNFIIGQGGIADASLVTFNMNGGDVNVGNDLNINDGTAALNQAGGFLTVRDLQTSDGAGESSTITLTGGEFEIRDDLIDRAGATTIDIAGGHLNLADATPTTREVENLTFSSGTITFAVDDPTAGPVALNLGVGGGTTADFTGAGLIDLEIVDLPGTGATITSWTGGSSTWDTTSGADWDAGNPIQYIASGTTFDVITSAGVIFTSPTDLASANPDFTLNVVDAGLATNKVEAIAATDVATTPIKAVITAAAPTDVITRGLDLAIGEFVGADAAELDMNLGILDLTGNDIQLGATPTGLTSGDNAQGTINLNGGSITNVGNITFGDAADSEGGFLQLNGGTLNVLGDITELDPSVDNAQLHIDGGTLTVGGDILVQRFAVGNNTGTTGAYTADFGQSITSTGTTAIGSSGTGTYNIIEGSTHTVQNNMVIGETATGTGTVNQDGGTLTVANTLAIGDLGDGTYNLTDGAIIVTGGGLRVADRAGTGTFNIGTPDGTTAPTISVSGGNFETADVGTGTVNFHSGTVTMVTNNFITGQAAGSVANVTIGGGTIAATINSTGNRQWNTNSGQGNVDILQNGVVNIGDSMQLGSADDGRLDLDIIGGELHIGTNNASSDLNYRTGSTGVDHLKFTSALLTIADDLLFDDGAGIFQVNGSDNSITVGDAYTQASGNNLVFAFDAGGNSTIAIGGDADLLAGSTVTIDETGLLALSTTANTTLAVAGAWTGADTGWSHDNPDGAGSLAGGERFVLATSGGTLTNASTLSSGSGDWAFETSVANELAVSYTGPTADTGLVHAILDNDGTTTRTTTDLNIAATAGADAAGLTITSSDILSLSAGATLMVSDGAELSGEGTVAGGSTIISTGGSLDLGDTITGLVGGASDIGQMTFDALALDAGSTTIIGIRAAIGAVAGAGFLSDDEIAALIPTTLDPTTEHDGATASSLVLSNTATIALDNLAGTSFKKGDFFDIFDVLGGTGMITGVTEDDLENIFDFSRLGLSSVQYINTSLFLSEGILFVSAPEPSRALFIALGIAAGLLRRRKG